MRYSNCDIRYKKFYKVFSRYYIVKSSKNRLVNDIVYGDYYIRDAFRSLFGTYMNDDTIIIWFKYAEI
jgi:hypothetical protein